MKTILLKISFIPKNVLIFIVFSCFIDSKFLYANTNYKDEKINEIKRNPPDQKDQQTDPQEVQEAYRNPSQDYEDFEEIIEGFSEPPSYEPKILTSYQEDTLSHTIFHGSIGFSYIGTGLKEKNKTYLRELQGLEITFGIHLFSPFWLSEATFRFFGPTKIKNKDIHISEFNLKLIHKPYFGKYFHTRVGIGFLNRYSTVKIENNSSVSANRIKDAHHISPALSLLFGLEMPINSFISLSTEIEYALFLVTENMDRQSLETAFKMNAYF